MENRLRSATAHVVRLTNEVKEFTKKSYPLFNGNQILSKSDVIKILGVSARTLQTWRTTGKISYIMLGGKVIYLSSDIQVMLEANYRKGE